MGEEGTFKRQKGTDVDLQGPHEQQQGKYFIYRISEPVFIPISLKNLRGMWGKRSGENHNLRTDSSVAELGSLGSGVWAKPSEGLTGQYPAAAEDYFYD